MFLFWTIYREPVLVALAAGKAANVMESVTDRVIVTRTLQVLRGIYGNDAVPEVSMTSLLAYDDVIFTSYTAEIFDGHKMEK